MDKKVKKRIMDMFNNRVFEDIDDIGIKPHVKKHLFQYQFLHVFNLSTAIKHNNIAIDGSATGTGKTYTAIAVCKQMNLTPIIICSKTTRSNWSMVCKIFDVDPIAVVNYELLRNCKVYNEDNKKIDADFIRKTEDGKRYKWKIKNPRRTILIFDEVHRCKNYKSQLGRLLIDAKHQCKILMLSATLCDKLNDFSSFGYMLGLYGKLSQSKNWIKGIIREDTKKICGERSNAMADSLFPDKGSRMMIEDIGEAFPKNQISAECFDLDVKDIQKMNKRLSKLKKLRGEKDTLVEISDVRQEIEKLKIPIIIEEIMKYYESGRSVVVFVNFVNTLDTISEYLQKNNILHATVQGGQNAEERELNIELFQFNKNRVILCTIQSGGESISLHDTTGEHPRVSLISPSLSSIELVQALGRIYRSDTRSPCLQKIIFCADTYEERICDIIREKSELINKLTDEDLINF